MHMYFYFPSLDLQIDIRACTSLVPDNASSSCRSTVCAQSKKEKEKSLLVFLKNNYTASFLKKKKKIELATISENNLYREQGVNKKKCQIFAPQVPRETTD